MQNLFCTRGRNNFGVFMSHYRRAKFCGGYYFFTIVCYKMRKIFSDVLARKCLRNAFEKVRSKRHFETIAFCLLPEHLHCIWKLPENDGDFSIRWSLIKRDFTINYLKEGGKDSAQSNSRLKHRHRGIWQKRFWEHQIRDERDLQSHIDYIHYNPVKHGLVGEVVNWPWSTYHKYIESGYYGKIDLEKMRECVNSIFVNE